MLQANGKLLIAFPTLLIVVALAHAEHDRSPGHDWPRFLGPRINGISQETKWRKQWDEPPALLWQVEIGVGFSSLAVSEGRLLTMGHEVNESDEEDARGIDRVFCFDSSSGKLLWKHEYACKQNRHLHEGGPGATPTVAGRVVYTLSREGHLFCLRTDNGKPVWSRFLPDDLEVEMPEWGFVSSPLLWNDLLIVDAGHLAAYDRRTGELRWKSEKYRPGYGSAIPFRHAGQDGLAVLNNDFLLLVRAADGKEIAKTAWETSFATNSTTPIVVDDKFFISTGYNRGCSLLRLSGGELERIYENKNMRNHFNNCVLLDGHLYGIDGNTHDRRNATLCCIDFETGERKWRERDTGVGSVILAGDTLLVLTDFGELITVEPSPDEYKEISRADILDGLCWTPPVLSHGLLYARDAGGHLVCVDLRADEVD
ncbi:MAG: PQQ-like beta-propeller repeat protein [Planctomycetales bacterium]|nr:PQQ-like beta-propeller repeat protein [Planctomycetales bacterium]